MKSATLATALVATALAASGCTTGAAPASPLADSFSVGESASSGSEVLRGVVVNDELAPIAGAYVVVDTRSPVLTDDQGAFEVGGLEPGEHKILVQALGYSGLIRTVVLPLVGEGLVRITLAPVPIQSPHIELVILRGYSICDISLVVWITIISPCPIGTPVRFVVVQMADSWRYGVVEMEWIALESFILYTSLDQNCNTGNQCFGAVAGRSPLRLEMAPEDEEIAKEYAPFTTVTRPYPEGKFRLQSNVIYAGALQKEADDAAHAPCVAAIGFRFGCPGVGVSAAGLPFTKYISVFHWERPVDPDSYSGMPDG